MKINTLEYLLVLAQSSSISEAAQRLYIAQPTLTKALHQLEQEIGVRLFDRSREGIALTSAGERILPQAKQIVAYYQEWLELGRQTALQSIDICVGRSFSDLLIPNILVKFRQRHPNVPVNYIVSREPCELISRSLQRPVIALFACNHETLQHCSELQGNRPTLLMPVEFRCLVSRNSPLARLKTVALQNLKDLFLVLPGSGENGNENYSHSLGVFPSKQIIHVETLTNVISQVAENPQTYALSHYPTLRRYEQVRSGELVFPPFEMHQEEMSLCLFYLKQAYDQHPLVAELVSSICTEFERFIEEFG